MVNAAFARLAPSVLSRIGSALAQPIDALRVRIQDVFGEHVRFTFDRCSKVKTIVADERPLDLRDMYVRLNISSSGSVFPDYSLAQPGREHNSVLIRGTAGAGKTMLMKYLALETFANGVHLPIFIDLRDIGHPREESFLRSVFRLCTPEGSNKGFELFHAGLRTGLFSFFFDGLDEVNPSYREKTFQQIQRFPFEFPDILVTISTRPETEVGGFSRYMNYKLLDLSEDQAVELIEKTDFHDERKKAAFIEKLNTGLYQEKQSFASNPLLCLLMLMTFSDAGEIPDRAAVFYDQAFETLFIRHDISKGPFRRVHRTGLRKREFRVLFGLVCYRTLANHEVSFEDIDLRHHVQRAVELCEAECDPDDFIMDCLEGVCLLHRDGGKIHFLHRSFQEFFVADFLSNYRNDNIFDVFNEILSDPIASRVAPLLHDLSAPLLEETWIIPSIQKAIDVLDQGDVSADMNYLGRFVHALIVSDDTGRVSNVEWILGKEIEQLMKVLSVVYPETGLSEKRLELLGVRMFPERYTTFREFLLSDPMVPQKVITRIEQESAEIEQANRERTAMTQRKVRSWVLQLDKQALANWIDSTEIVSVFPNLLAELRALNDKLVSKSERRRTVNLLS